MSNILSRDFVYTPSSRTDVSKRFRAAGWQPPETRAEEHERDARIEGALICMKRLQAEQPRASVIRLADKRRAK